MLAFCMWLWLLWLLLRLPVPLLFLLLRTLSGQLQVPLNREVCILLCLLQLLLMRQRHVLLLCLHGLIRDITSDAMLAHGSQEGITLATHCTQRRLFLLKPCI